MAAPFHIAAIDAGSNAIRLAISRVYSPTHVEEIEFERMPVRLGHGVFLNRKFDADTIRRGVKAFRYFRSLMDRYRVSAYRAVATSAAREARNRRELLERVRREARLQIEVIDNEEEARLVRRAVLARLGHELEPRLIVDLGGGSLEVNLLRGDKVEASVGLPLGTVRLMESHKLGGKISREQARKLRTHILHVMQSCLPRHVDLRRAIAVACGGNAEALAQVAPWPQVRGIETLDLRRLRARIPEILDHSAAERMKLFRVRPDRADVMAVASIVFNSFRRWANVQRMLVPGVGVRHGILRDLVEDHFARVAPESIAAQERALLASAERFARSLNDDAAHGELTRRLALSLFDQLRHIHGMGEEERLILDLGARLHDIGRVVNEEAHHKHGEYLIRHGNIPELRGWRRDMVACLVRYHNRRSQPDVEHKLYAGLDAGQRAHVRALTALLRIADGLDRDRNQLVQRVDIETTRREAGFRVHMRSPSNAPLWGAQRRAGLFEEEFGLKATFTRSLSGQLVA